MRWPEENTNPFPSPHRQEPAVLRADILDELADHLALSAEHEMEFNGQTRTAAWARALDRFGDPDAVARRLWWDAMKGKVMRDWIQTGIAGLSAVVVLFVGIYVIMNMQSMQATQAKLAETLQRMNGQSQTPAGETLDIEVRRGKADGPPAAGVRVELRARTVGKDNWPVSLETDAQGRMKFFPVPEGTYAITIHDPQSGMTLRTDHTVFAGVGTARKLVAPDVALARAQLVLKQPLPFPNNRMLVCVKCSGTLSVGDCRWNPEAEFFVGNAGMYEFVQETGYSQCATIKGPATMLLLPAIALTFTACPILRNPKYPPDQLCMENMPCQEAIQSVTLTAGQENVVTMELTANQVQKAEQYMKAYAAKRWMPERNADEPPPLDGYVWAAHPIEDTVRVRCGMTSTMADAAPATVTFPGSGEDAKECTAGGGMDWRMLTIVDMANLTKTYPSECRFLISSGALISHSVFPWKRTACSRESGQPFPLEVGPALHFEVLRDREVAYVDITAFVRGDAAAAPCAGVLLLAPCPQPDNGELTWRSPHLLVVSDTPPEDL